MVTKNLEEKPFWRPSNIWRLIGGLLSFFGFWSILFLPSAIYPDIVLVRSKESLFTVWHLVTIVGLTSAFQPTIKELIIEMIKAWRK